MVHNVLGDKTSSPEYRLLHLLRSFCILNTLASLEVHTEETIARGRAELLNFSFLLEVSFK